MSDYYQNARSGSYHMPYASLRLARCAHCFKQVTLCFLGMADSVLSIFTDSRLIQSTMAFGLDDDRVLFLVSQPHLLLLANLCMTFRYIFFKNNLDYYAANFFFDILMIKTSTLLSVAYNNPQICSLSTSTSVNSSFFLPTLLQFLLSNL